MILECPSCHNRYLVDPRAVGVKGRTVRCAKCRYEWFAEPARDEPEDDIISIEEIAEQKIPPIPEGSSVPAIATARGAPVWLKTATGMMAVLCVLVSLVYFHKGIIHTVPALEGAYASMGMFTSEGVVFADLEYENIPPKKDAIQLKDEHRFKGVMVNTSSEPRHLPNVLITLLDKNGEVIRRQPVVGDRILAPGESQSFDPVLSTMPQSLRHVIIELGSPYELSLR